MAGVKELTQVPTVGVVGASGRMGRMLIKVVSDSDRVQLGTVIERPDHPWIGKALKDVYPDVPLEMIVESELEVACSEVEVLIDFSSPAASTGVATFAAKHGKIHVVGTTGFGKEHDAHIAECAQDTVIIKAGNMSLGVNLLTKLTERVAAALDEDFDIEIVEAHHRYKVDAPSGTALMLGKAAAKGRKIDLMDHLDKPRDGQIGARAKGNIGFSAIRGGNIVGEHEVMFAADGERIVLSHIATDRTIYASGALKAALWGLGKRPGLYDMADVLGL